MTYREICEKLKNAGIDSYNYDALILTEHFTGETAAEIKAWQDRDYVDSELADAVEKRCRRFPLQYIVGHWAFCNNEYEVSPDCLIPRADTELLVETAIRLLPHGAHFADLCTGSGCIAISTLSERPDCRATAVELYGKALNIAERNAERNGVSDRIKFICADVLDGKCLAASYDTQSDRPKFDAVISNPPYIPTKDIDGLGEEVRCEPRAALDGGTDGLVFYRTVISYCGEYLKEGGFVLFEIGYDQADAVCGIARDNGYTCTVHKDLEGNNRMVLLRRATEVNKI